MAKNLVIWSLLISTLIPVYSHADSAEYPYKVLVGATGNRTLIKVNDSWIHIRYSNYSNKEALEMLLGLKWEVLDKNSENKIFIRGQLLSSYGRDIGGGRKVFDFILHDWKISCPFEYYVMPEEWLPGDNIPVKTKDVLDGSCFNSEATAFEKYCNFGNP